MGNNLQRSMVSFQTDLPCSLSGVLRKIKKDWPFVMDSDVSIERGCRLITSSPHLH